MLVLKQITCITISSKKLNLKNMALPLDTYMDDLESIEKISDVDKTMALRLSKFLGRSPESWMLMQNQFRKVNAKG